jgi:hypothetical protein
MDFFLLFAPKVIILDDAQAIFFLRLCKDSQGILLRFSLELSKYDAEGQIVPHSQQQVATGSAMSLKPRFTLPYVVEELLPDGSSALIENLNTSHIMKAHFSNLKVINYHPAVNHVHANFDNDLQSAIDRDTNDNLDKNLSKMLTQGTSLLTRTVRPLGDVNWEKDHRKRTRLQISR